MGEEKQSLAKDLILFVAFLRRMMGAGTLFLVLVPSPLPEHHGHRARAEPPLWLWQRPGRTWGCRGRGWRDRHSTELFSSSCREVQPEVGETSRKWSVPAGLRRGAGWLCSGASALALQRAVGTSRSSVRQSWWLHPSCLCREISSFRSSDEFQHILHNKSPFHAFLSLEPLPPSLQPPFPHLLFHLHPLNPSASPPGHPVSSWGPNSRFSPGSGHAFLPVERARGGNTLLSPPGQPQVRPPPQPLGPCTLLLPNGAGRGPDPASANGETGNGTCRAVPSTQKPHRKLQSHHSINSQSSKKSKGSSKSPSSHIPIEAQEDCCVHCILSCLFCEFLTLCNIVLDCATCGSCTSEDSCICCCCCNSGECADCDLPCDMDCGIIDACCESADCLEICMECCGLCFSS
ncbi:myoD family inhibitor [Cyanistes caeruleus]|uniref:MyoD family inhibitor n=1 Tax=Cyanistes caeruleus TaxID=156563 RepID=A0A8C0V9C6_CYACU|nr:myoD family inhibitor [Cyanistes caeruleus]